MIINTQSDIESRNGLEAHLKVLTAAQVMRIDELLAAVGEFGEVHLVVQHRQLRYINQVHSYKVDTGPLQRK